MSNMRKKMPVSQRAKQFMAFAALKGLSEALAEKEKVVVPRKILSEDMADELDRQLHKVRKGVTARAVYYFDCDYVTAVGEVTDINPQKRSLTIQQIRIPFDDLLELTV